MYVRNKMPSKTVCTTFPLSFINLYNIMININLGRCSISFYKISSCLSYLEKKSPSRQTRSPFERHDPNRSPPSVEVSSPSSKLEGKGVITLVQLSKISFSSSFFLLPIPICLLRLPPPAASAGFIFNILLLLLAWPIKSRGIFVGFGF